MRFNPLSPTTDPEPLYPPYRSNVKRGPTRPPVRVSAPNATDRRMSFAPELIKPHDADLTAHGLGAPLGQKIVVAGRVVDEQGKPVRNALIEVWQCNAAGRYRHEKDQHDAPLDPNFFGTGKFLTNGDGQYRFVTIQPGAYPWANHEKAWRPAHIHFSLFGNVFAQRLVTQMYFPNDPLFAFDPIYQSVRDPAARARLCARFSLEETVSDQMLGYVFDIVLRGRDATPFGL